MKQIQKIIWTEEFSVKVKKMDDDHKKLLSFYSKMAEHVENNGNSEAFVDVLSEMTEYAVTHFNKEENYMESISYPKIEEHKEFHRQYLLSTVSFNLNYLGSDNSKPIEVLQFLRNWWENHILNIDMDYAIYLSKNKTDTK